MDAIPSWQAEQPRHGWPPKEAVTSQAGQAGTHLWNTCCLQLPRRAASHAKAYLPTMPNSTMMAAYTIPPSYIKGGQTPTSPTPAFSQ